ncbi:MAG: hypothetical protein A3E85_03745 [Gammaproteobacteria bacterium RIFCSPHIGHO2_12_FULL_45_12]|nr:MAG: hypothetical protein A3E85_03745 [Gammaproteobacteria bacterium RIFCSPHIGHO2_12_FULL_45_12]
MVSKLYQHDALRRAVCAALAMAAAVMLSQCAVFGGGIWVMLAALFVSQVARGTPLRQSFVRLMLVVGSVLLSVSMMRVLHADWQIVLVSVILYVVVGMVIFMRRPMEVTQFNLAIILLLSFLVTLLSKNEASVTPSQLIAGAVAGGAIGVIFAQLTFPLNPYHAFSHDMVFILRSIHDYGSVLAEKLVRHASEREVRQQQMNLDRLLCLREGCYPEWVYDAGFNPGLRSGYRFFLIKSGRVIELLNSMNYLIMGSMDQALLSQVANAIHDAMQVNNELLRLMADHFEGHQPIEIISDMTSDIMRLNACLAQVVPLKRARLNLSGDDVALTALVRDVNDLREVLLQLALA